jgi:hypothetical protein
MSNAKLLLNAYHELLYDHLLEHKHRCRDRLRALIVEQIDCRQFDLNDEEKISAYVEAALAFVEERLESYNPVGIQWTFPPTSKEEAFALEAALDWYDSRAEFAALQQGARDLLGELSKKDSLSPTTLRRLAGQLIRDRGAYPDRSIIAAYQADPTPNKLPDYVVSCLIEELLPLSIDDENPNDTL